MNITLHELIGGLIVAFALFFFVYAIIDRICRCIENSNMAKAYAKWKTDFSELETKMSKELESLKGE